GHVGRLWIRGIWDVVRRLVFSERLHVGLGTYGIAPLCTSRTSRAVSERRESL
ncbi:MAG: hypothetical protein AVDCRST_MAG93-2653, partial [uncultured Chloroflexia bacterium]